MLPRIPYKMRKNKSQITAFRGINYSNVTREGDIADSKNISARAYPYLTTRRGRSRENLHLFDGKKITGVTMFMGELVVVANNVLYFGETEVGELNRSIDTERKFAPINTKLCIMPDKMYLDLQGEEPILRNMGASVELCAVEFTDDSLKVSGGLQKLASGFGYTVTAAEDKVTVDISDHRTKELSCDRIGAVGTSLYLCEGRGSMNLKLRIGDDSSFVLDTGTTPLAASEGDVIFLSDGSIYKVISGSKFRYTVARRSLRIWQESYPSASTHPSASMSTWDDILKEHNGVEVYVSKLNGYSDKGNKLRLVTGTLDVYLAVSGVDERAIDVTANVGDGLHEGVLTTAGWESDFSFSQETVGKEVIIASKMVGRVTARVDSVTMDSVTLSGAKMRAGAYYEDLAFYIENDGAPDLRELFRAGDCVTISGDVEKTDFIISDVLYGSEINDAGDTVSIATLVATKSGRFTDEAGRVAAVVNVERRIPDLDFICESDNRLWGCSNADNTIYVSALGDPTNFFVNEVISTDAFAVAVGSEGEFTACCRYGSDVLFWKETKLHKVIGSYPAEYTIYSYDIEGVQAGCDKSLAVINEVLYYKGIHGVYAFTSSPTLISSNFGERYFTDAVAGVDGDSYYLSVKGDDNRSYLFVYETLLGLWILEDDVRALDFIRDGKDFYMRTEGGEFYRCGASDTGTDMEWFVQLTPFYETLEGRKTYSKLLLRVELPKGSYLRIEVRTDGGAWREAGKIIGKSCNAFPLNVPINRCDKFEIRLGGKGKCTVLSMMREFYVSSGL